MNKGMNMTNLTRDEQKAIMVSRFPEAGRIVFNTEFKQWDVTTIIGVEDEYGDIETDSFAYIPGTRKFRFCGHISCEI